MAKSITIGQVCKVITGKLDANAADENGKYPFFTCSVAPLRINNFAYDSECVLIAGNGDLNVKYYNGKFNAYQRTYIISLKDGVSDVSVRYLYAFFLSYIDTLRKRSIGSTIKYIRLGDITEASIFLPSFPEQQRIVDILDREFAKIDALKANAEKSLQAAKDLFQATLKNELEPKEGWKRKQIGDLCEIYNGGTPSTSITSYWDGGIQWITPKDMGKSKEMYVAQCERTITKEGVEHSSAKVLPVRSVIVSSRAPIGYVAINSVPMATNQGCKGFIPGKDLYPEFLYYFFLSSTELLNKLGTGATFKEVSGRKLAEISLDYPVIERQQEIASHILSLSHSCSILQQNYQKTLTLCDDLKQSLLRKAFNGEL